MTDPSPSDPRMPVGGGAPIALLIVAGAVVGGLMGQPVIGLLAGLALGVLIAIALWRMGPR